MGRRAGVGVLRYSPEVMAPAEPPAAVLLVHGIWDSAERLEPLRRGLADRGIADLVAMDLQPNDGRAPIAQLSGQVAARAEALATGGRRVDIVGFSMGALVSRHYIQRGGGKSTVRRFVSISGPHRGTLTAYGLPFDGARDMRPGSALLEGLDGDHDPWGEVEVHAVYTPFDLMILPPTSSVLAGARSVRRIGVPMHRFMIRDRRVLDHVAALLSHEVR